jgi:hypothetical protein
MKNPKNLTTASCIKMIINETSQNDSKIRRNDVFSATRSGNEPP